MRDTLSRSLLRLNVNSISFEDVHLHIEDVKRTPGHKQHLRIFDFDDTLCVTDSVVILVSGSLKTSLTPSQYASHIMKPGDAFDYSEFTKLVNPRPTKLVELFTTIHSLHGPSGLAILSARTTDGPIHDFLKIHSLHEVHVKALANGDPMAKKHTVASWISERSLTYVEFFDDSEKNVQAIEALASEFPEVKIVSRHVR